jgi:hypothetical protein
MGGGKFFNSLSSNKDDFLVVGAEEVTDDAGKEVFSLSLFRELMVFLYLSGESAVAEDRLA